MNKHLIKIIPVAGLALVSILSGCSGPEESKVSDKTSCSDFPVEAINNIRVILGTSASNQVDFKAREAASIAAWEETEAGTKKGYENNPFGFEGIKIDSLEQSSDIFFQAYKNNDSAQKATPSEAAQSALKSGIEFDSQPGQQLYQCAMRPTPSH